MPAAEIAAIVDWLVDGARSAPHAPEVLSELCERLLRAGLPLWRVGVFVRTLHPEVSGRRFAWQEGAGTAIAEIPFAIVEAPDFRDGPLPRAFATGEGFRRRLADPECPVDFGLLERLRAEGVTDFLALPLVFGDGSIHLTSWTTRQPGGFAAAQEAAILAILPALARIGEIHALRRTAGNLLDTYVGHQAGSRILAGHIRRGDTESIQAAIWLSDMRGFTALADRLPPRQLIDILNRYFDCQVPAILSRGGEVLKFMGDGLLAIFPLAAGEESWRRLCREVLAAAREARERIAAADLPPPLGGGPRFGLALHLGEVLYGNIGAGNRLDFTCIGPAINLAARIEKLARDSGRAILASAEFAWHCEEGLLALGEVALAGFAAPQMVYSLADGPDASASASAAAQGSRKMASDEERRG